jgi:hypothetical protein
MRSKRTRDLTGREAGLTSGSRKSLTRASTWYDASLAEEPEMHE